MKPYCLKCFAPLPSNETTCAACGFLNLPSQRRKYWNRNPELVQLEQTIKAFTVALCLILAVAVTLSMRAYSIHQGWLVAFPVIAVGVGIWQTASRLTQRCVHFRPTLFWALALGILGAFGLLVDWRLSLGCAFLITLVVLAGAGLKEWKQRKVTSGMTP